MQNMKTKKYSLILFVLMSLFNIVKAQRPIASCMVRTLDDAFGYPYKVTEVIDLNDPMTPDKFYCEIVMKLDKNMTNASF